MDGLSKDLRQLIGDKRVRTDPEDLFSYQSDATHHFARGKPDAIVLPVSAAEISRVVKYASDNGIPVTPRGAGSGLSGACTPIEGGIVLDMKRMNRIIDINRGNLTATVECGVVTANFHRRVEKERLFYPPDPQSMSVCTLGGNVATRAGGPRGVKYGTTGNYVLGLEVVLPDGSVINTGGTCVKQSVGYDLTHLLTGSEGTLGVLTQIHTRLIPLPPAHRTVVIACESPDQASRVVSEIIAAGIVPAVLEYLTGGAIGLMNTMITPPLKTEGKAYLLLDVDGTESQIDEESKRIADLCRDMKTMDVRVVEDEKEAATYWKARSSLMPLTMLMAKKMIIEDVTVPRDKIPEFVQAVEKISADSGILVGVNGHAGDGNIHPTVILSEVNEKTEKAAQEVIKEIVAVGLKMGGSISGEHGIGLHKAEFLAQQLGQRQVELHKQIKKAIDPVGIMNPGKIWTQGGAQ
ncbi:MAG: FAD-binding protein [Proteobacteria bacterium]|nr:FAD-binding protein [Pseudomonadota bacterium]